MNDIDDIIQRLQSSPLFYLFLSSRELFHSNFWQWLSTLNAKETARLFTDTQFEDNLTFKREHNQSSKNGKSKVDLLLSTKENHEVVVENKIKDFPKAEQLERIQTSFENQVSQPEYVLATLFWSTDISFNGWDVRRYNEISDTIIPMNFTEDAYYISLINDYKDFTLTLSELADSLDISRNYNFAISENHQLFDKLNSVKLWEGYQRLRASHLLHHYNMIKSTDVHTANSINNQKATIDFFLHLPKKYKIGIQLEDIQYRFCVMGEKAAKFASNLIEKDVFLNGSFSGRGDKPYLNYGPHFKYQYERISNMSFIDLFRRINLDIDLIRRDWNNIIAEIP